jgi:opacity protein-like surface antigen
MTTRKDETLSLRKHILAILLFISLPTQAAYFFGPALTYQNIGVSGNRYQALAPRLTLGYGDWYNDWFYFAGELFGSPRFFQLNNQPENGQSLRIKYLYGISVVPGVKVNDVVMAYARIGEAISRFDSLNITRRGFVGGLGMETPLTKAWSLRAEFEYIKYNSITSVGSPVSKGVIVGGLYRIDY